MDDKQKVTTERIIFGDQGPFGVEFAKANSWPYIHVRLWICDNWVGDIEDSLMPEQMCASLLRLGSQRKSPTNLAFRSEVECPTYDELSYRGGWSFGESFDPFGLVFYMTLVDERVHFCWKLHEVYYPQYPDYPRELHHFSVALSAYTAVVTPFVQALIDDGYYRPRPGVPGPADMG